MKPRKLGNNTIPPEGAPLCATCETYAYGGTTRGQHCVKLGGVWHHPSCTLISPRRAPPRYLAAPREPSPVQRMLVLFKPLAIVAFYTLGASTIALATVAACAWLSG